jgi:TolB-like protein
MTSFLTASILAKKDQNPPVIKVKDWTDEQSVFMDKIYLEGEIIDDAKVVAVTVNQVPVLRREGQIIFFNQLIDLQVGKNEISIQASDQTGNTSTKKISVIRQTPKALALSERLSVAVLPFEPRGDVTEAFLSFQEKLINALIDRERFNLVERDKLDMILQEQKLSQTDLVDKSTAVKVGKLVAARSIVTGSVIETRTGVEIVARMIDTETSEILAAEDVYGEVKDLRGSAALSDGMAVKFHQEFPLVCGEVIQQKGNEVLTTLGQGMVKVPRRLIVYREEPVTHPVTGKTLGSDTVILGRLRVTQVMQDLSKAKLQDGEAANIKPMDKVVTE